MKKLVLILLVAAMLLSLPACKKAQKPTDAPVEKSPVNFDLSKYDAHGELSCGLIWVEKTVSAYDKPPQTTFAYLDKDGKEKSPWFDSEEYTKANFINNILVLKQTPYTPEGDAREYARCIVYDTEFKALADASFETVLDKSRRTRLVAISDANQRGEVFGFASIEETGLGLYMITEKGMVNFPVAASALAYDTVENLGRIRFENGYYVVDLREDLGNSPSYLGIFDQEGNRIFEPSEQIGFEVFSVSVLAENEFEVQFIGKDGEKYTVTTDSTGTFLNDPK